MVATIVTPHAQESTSLGPPAPHDRKQGCWVARSKRLIREHIIHYIFPNVSEMPAPSAQVRLSVSLPSIKQCLKRLGPAKAVAKRRQLKI